MKKSILCPHCREIMIITLSIDGIEKTDTRWENWGKFINNLNFPGHIHNKLIQAYWQFNQHQDRFFDNDKDFDDLVSWFVKEIKKPDGGKTYLIRNFGIKSLEIVREKLLVEA